MQICKVDWRSKKERPGKKFFVMFNLKFFFIAIVHDTWVNHSVINVCVLSFIVAATLEKPAAGKELKILIKRGAAFTAAPRVGIKIASINLTLTLI